MPESIPVRTGIPTLLKITQQLCTYLGRWIDVIVIVVDEDEDVVDALQQLNAACTLLLTVLGPYRPTGT